MPAINAETQEELYKEINAQFLELYLELPEGSLARARATEINKHFIIYADRARLLSQKPQTTNKGNELI